MVSKEKMKEYRKKWVDKNKEKVKRQVKKWQDSNKDKVKKINQRHWKKHGYSKRKKIINDNRDTYNKKVRKYTRKHRAAKKCIIEDFSNKEWIEKLKDTFGLCPQCGNYVGTAHLEIDHIYPVSLAYADYNSTGIKRVYTINDVQPLCKSCNCSKGGRL